MPALAGKESVGFEFFYAHHGRILRPHDDGAPGVGGANDWLVPDSVRFRWAAFPGRHVHCLPVPSDMRRSPEIDVSIANRMFQGTIPMLIERRLFFP